MGPFIRILLVLTTLVCLLYGSPTRAVRNGFDAVVNHPAIPLLDETGRHVLDSGKPYSSRMSCGNGEGSGCHDYGKISSAYHFEQGRDQARDGFGQMRGLPHLVSPGYFGGYNCMGGNNPGWLALRQNADATGFGDFGAAGLLRECAECHAGAGWSEYDRQGRRYDAVADDGSAPFDGDYFDRQGLDIIPWDWHQSGVMENDCMICHADLSSLTRFTTRGPQRAGALKAWLDLRNRELAGQGLFRAVDSAFWAFLNLRPKQPGGGALLRFEREHQAETAPLRLNDGQVVLRWNPKAFNALGKISVPMRRFPASDNCIVCHKTGEDRRGFYGFGGESSPRIRDVHLGKRFMADNGETRFINNCNACHAKRYLEPKFANVALDADHHFPKGNGDSDVRNDLDGMPGATACEQCHNTARYPALPSGQKDILSAHLQLWRTHGDLDGYSPAILTKITQSHLDTVACQTCHINRLVDSDGKPLTLNFRFRRGDDQMAKIFPYNPAFRYFIQDRVSGRVLYRHERDSAFEQKTTATGERYLAIVDPLTRTETGRAVRTAAGEAEPDTYSGFKALKQAYDRLLVDKGYPGADTRFVYVEANRYVISHNTAPSPRSVACGECHSRSANGSFSARLAPTGLLGAQREISLTRLPDPRLVTEGIVALSLPYLRVDEQGRVFKTVGDELYASRFESSLSVLNAETTRSIEGLFKQRPMSEATVFADIDPGLAARLQAGLAADDWLLFNSRVAHASLRGVALLAADTPRNRTLLGDSRLRVDSRSPTPTDRQQIGMAVTGSVTGDILTLRLTDAAGQPQKSLDDGQVLMLLPYSGTATRLDQLRVACSAEGQTWTAAASPDLLELQAATETGEPGRLLMRVDAACRERVIVDRTPGSASAQ